MKPRLLDLFCGAGGATRGYQRAGFYVVGVDSRPQPHYCGDEFIEADALDWGVTWSGSFNAVHASPPCQGYSKATRHLATSDYPRLIEPVRELLQARRLPFVIENVVGAPLRDPVTLCGAMFGRRLYRHRLFELSFPIDRQLPHPRHLTPASKAGHYRPGTFISVAGNCAPIQMVRHEMGIDWTTRDELAEAIPPYFTEWIGGELLRLI